jgi:hypothetical protein
MARVPGQAFALGDPLQRIDVQVAHDRVMMQAQDVVHSTPPNAGSNCRRTHFFGLLSVSRTSLMTSS